MKTFHLDSQTIFTPARLAAGSGHLRQLPALDDVPLPIGIRMQHEMVASPSGRISTLRLVRSEPGPLILFIGGNNFFIARSAGFVAARLAGLGDLLFCDHAGYGRSEGQAVPGDMVAGALGVAAHARAVADREQRPLVVWGASLGGFLAVHAAATHGADALVLEAVAPTAQRWAQSMAARRGIASCTVEPAIDEFAHFKPLMGYRGKVLHLAGLNDRMLPVALSREAHEWCRAHGVDAEYHELSNDAHNLKPLGATLDVVGDFLARHALLDPAGRLDPKDFRAVNPGAAAPAAAAGEAVARSAD